MNYRILPPEIVASVLAGLTAFIGGNILNLPTWGIFIAWAGTFLLGGPSLDNAKRLWRAMPAGSTFALAIVLVDGWLGTALGSSTLAKDVVLGVVIFVFNSALMYTGRTRLFALVPGMFFGFASFFATFFGGFGFVPHNPFAAWLSVVVMNALGPVFAYLNVRLAAAHSGPAHVGTAEAESAGESGSATRPEPTAG